ncbi:BBE domain-containing protein [Streptomyces sp. NPDC001340]
MIFPVDGACHRVGPQDTAFVYRDACFSTALSPTLTTRAGCEAQKGWARAFHRALEPYSAGGGYSHARLVELKRRYDPGNLFRLNHNIAP